MFASPVQDDARSIDEPRRPQTDHAPFIVYCAWCGRRSTDDGWVEEEADDEEAVFVSHGICDDCLKRLKRRGETA